MTRRYYQSMDPEDRFWLFVDKGDYCWNWNGSLYHKGAGDFYWNSVRLTSYRASWLIHYGWLPTNRFICHTCDNRRCVNPDHLFVGDAMANNRDMHQKGRGVIRSKLNYSQVCEIRKSKEPPEVIAQRYGVCRRTIRFILSGVSWRKPMRSSADTATAQTKARKR